MNSNQTKTLKAIFSVPVRSDIKWIEIEAFLKHLGARIQQGNGSRVRVFLNGKVGSFHEPHPTNREVCKCTVKAVRDFLENAGIRLS